MAENLVKSLREKPPKIRTKRGFEELPDAKIKERPPKILKGKEPKKKRTRAGFIPHGINPNKKAEIISNGCKIK